jgi:hypothetical protein
MKKVEAGPGTAPDALHLHLPPMRASLLVQHSKYIRHKRDTLGKGVSKVVKCLLLGQRMTAKDAIWGT